MLKSHLLYRTTRIGSVFSKVLPTLTLPCRSELRWSSWCSGLAGGHRGRCSKCGADAHLGAKAATYTTVSHLKEPFEPYSLHGDLSEYCWSAGDSGACGWAASVLFPEIAIHIKSARSSPWLILNIVIDLHSGVKVHGRLMPSVLCSFKELNHGINLPKQLPSCNVLWKMEVCGLWFSFSKCTFFFMQPYCKQTVGIRKKQVWDLLSSVTHFLCHPVLS